MKAKLILGFALVLSGVFFIFSQSVKAGEVANATATMQANWADIEVTVYRTTGESVKLPAKSSICRIRTTTNYWGNYLVVAFVDPQNSRSWLGFASGDKKHGSEGFYVEAEKEIVGFGKDLFAGTLSWRENLIPNTVPGKGVSGLIQQFNELNSAPDSIHERWGASIMSGIDLSPHFRDCFFYPHKWSTNLGTTAIDHVEGADGKLRLDFTSPAYQTKGSVWLDLNTRKVLKAVEYKKQP